MQIVGVIVLLFLIPWVLWGSRRWALLGMMAGVLYLTQGVHLEVAGFSFFPTRILSWLCFIRVIGRREFSFDRVTKIDTAFLILYAFTTLIVVIRPGESIPLAMAKMLDVFFGYFAFRGLITGPDDLRWLLRILPVLLVPYVAMLAVERFTGRNPLVFVGGNAAPWLRDGEPRCFGSFRHPILLGSLGASFFPLYVALFCEVGQRRRAVLGAVLCIMVVGFANSGGPLSALAAGVVGWCLWPIRKQMRLFRWALALTIIALAIFMKAPVWYLIARVSSVTGGTGWHRSYLIDVAMRHFDEWWLAGLSLLQTKGWFPYDLAATGGADVTNQFIAFGLDAGIAAIGLFMLLLYRAYSQLGHSLEIVRSDSVSWPGEEVLLWGVGVMLVVHIVNWLGISYWDQFQTVWLMQAAALCAVSQFWLEESSGRDECSQDLEAMPSNGADVLFPHPPTLIRANLTERSSG